MNNEKQYESPRLELKKLNIFESIANQCWSNPSKYKVLDPTDNVWCDISTIEGIDGGCQGQAFSKATYVDEDS